MKTLAGERLRRVLGFAVASPVVLVIMAFAVRAVLLWVHLHQVDVAALVLDDEACNVARSIVEGKGFSSPYLTNTGATAYFAPVYPYLLAGIFKLFGTGSYRVMAAAATLNEIFSALTCIPIFYTARLIGGRSLGACAGWLWVFFPLAIVLPDVYVWYTPLSTLLAALLLWATLVVCDSDRISFWIFYGAGWGLALLTSAALLSLPPFLFAWLAWSRGKKKRPWVRLEALAALFIVLVCAPWVIRNYAVFHRFVPLASNFGYELWIENREVPAAGAEESATEFINKFRQMGEVDFARDRGRQAIQFMWNHPGEELQHIAGRILRTWLGTSHPMGDFLADTSWLDRVRLIFYIGFSALALSGLLILWRENPRVAWAVAVYPVAFPLVYYATHISVQYRLPIDPAMVVLTALTLTHVASAVCSPSAPAERPARTFRALAGRW